MAAQGNTIQADERRQFQRFEETTTEGRVERPVGPPMERRLYREKVTSAQWVTLGSLVEILGGAGALVLAILGFTGLVPGILTSVGIIVLGGALFLYGGFRGARTETHHWSWKLSAWTFSSLQTLVGLGAITLGILALSGVVPSILTLVSVLVIGASLMVCGMANSVRMMSMIGH